MMLHSMALRIPTTRSWCCWFCSSYCIDDEAWTKSAPFGQVQDGNIVNNEWKGGLGGCSTCQTGTESTETRLGNERKDTRQFLVEESSASSQ